MQYESAKHSTESIRQVAERLDIPRSTLQHWIERKDAIDSDPILKDFMESPTGTAFMHRLLIGIHFVITSLGACSVRHVCELIEISGLGPFVAASYGTQHKVAVQIEEAIIEFGREESERLAETMANKKITVCQDETFHPEPCLVAIEPESGYIITEKYADGRKSSDWTEAMEEATKGLKVEIVQSTSDEGKGILHHVKEGLGAHHSPDAFHVQNEIVKATSGPLASKVRKARINLEAASEKVNKIIDEKVAFDQEDPQRGRPPQFEKKIQEALKCEAQAIEDLKSAEACQSQVKGAVHKIGQCYHPFDLESGRLTDAEVVSQSLNRCFSEIEDVAKETGLAENSLKRIKKAKRVVVEMVATILFFYFTVRAKIEALSLSSELETAVLEKLIPAIYLDRASEKAKTADARERLHLKSEEILSSLRNPDSPFCGIDPEHLEEILSVSEECALLFQRSSSCVEGRNGQLSLRHHSLHRLSNRKLGSLTVVHNFHIKRRDGTTAACRFFGSTHKKLFDALLEKVDLPGRPARKRSTIMEKQPIMMAA